MTEIPGGRLLPNLTVSLGNEHNDFISSEKTEMIVDSNMIVDSTKDSTVEVVRPNFDNLMNPKVYMNRDGGFATGIDLIEQENSDVLSKRAERFGLEPSEDKETISSLYESLGIDVKNKDSAKMKHTRLNAIHVRGVDELETDEVFKFFQDYGPAYIEWINDSACNVLWFDDTSCARALLGLSKRLPSSFNPDFLKALKNPDEDDDSALDLRETKQKEEMEVDSSVSDVQVNIPVPPGQWRVAGPYKETKTILLRFATTVDKKVPGAEKRSKFYKKYGNPNYGGLKGLISSSRKHKEQAEANRWAVQKESSFKSSFSSRHSSSNTSIPMATKEKTIRMRMYADDEELKTEKLRSKGNLNQRKGSIHKRLGVKYTSEDLCRLGSYRDFDSPRDQITNYSYIKHKSPSRDGKSKRSSWDDFEPKRSSRDDFEPRRSSRDDFEPRRSSRDDFEPKQSSWDHFKPKRSSRDDFKQDLRSKLKRMKSRNNSDTYGSQSYHGNNRKIAVESSKHYKRVDDLKKESKSFYKRKHRSPLCADEDDDDGEVTSSSGD